MGNFDSAKSLKTKINLFFDNELANDEVASLLNMVDADPKGKVLFDKEKNFREYIRNNIRRPAVSMDLVETIRHKINNNHQ